MIKSLILTLQFLTRLPIPVSTEVDKKTLARGTFFYPYIGVLIGSLSYISYYLLYRVDNQIAALFIVLSIIAITGGFHLDGLSDTCDGFFSSRSRERIIEIMKDSRVGVFGVIAVVFDILIKFIVLSKISYKYMFFTLIFSLAFARLTAAFMFTFGKSAKKEGLGAQITQNRSEFYYILSVSSFMPIAFWFLGYVSLYIFFIDLAFAILLMLKSYNTIDGLTGDIYGACIEICEIIGFFIMFLKF
ncbi:adenosylcobinamide-GDP ribazoletransferase [Thermobrachium celere]|uniref:Adenosylcobinamide-GDP ribazoletransferase n=1 Tax=Thermobrachium celere DSM 8682 TaxID=941824 RepID=R7RPM9_9CLOT|nr:adenosylcobinamide-GDP ribazoletransferase [Thermobrachium celere]CDF57278.1 Cobalamin synthase [Thermobrachium celere DSM 8682]